MLAGACLSAAINYGHTCLPLYMLSPEKLFQGNYPKLAEEAHKKSGKLSIENWKELLSSISAVSDGSRLSPLILENENLYFHRMWQDECLIAKFFCSTKNKNSSKDIKIANILDQLFPKKSIDIDWPKIAAAISLIQQKTLISGGPGTGKTFIISKIVTAFILLHNRNNNLKIKITAPTGKATHHLTESFNTTINNLMLLNYQFSHILPKKATTIHHLLGSRLYKKSTQHNLFLTNPLYLDLLIIDESSMISLSILAQLIKNLSTHTKVIFLGDQNQLYPIAPGSVFQDICKYANFNYSLEYNQKLKKLTGYNIPLIPNTFMHCTQSNSIINNICILKKNFRFNETSGIHQLSVAINLGHVDRALFILNTSTYTDIHYIHNKNQKNYINMIINCAKKYYNYLKILKCTSTSIIDILKIFNQYQILCAIHDGPFGVTKINYYIEMILYQKGLIKLNKSKNYIGKPIIILKNSPSLELFNGDIGILFLNSKQQLSAYFLSSLNTIKIIPIYQLPPHETCFAMTIHKSQGSEFKNITIILPNQHQPILTRELLYTAVTRAIQKITLYGTNHVIIQSINLITKRYSGLYKKLQIFNLKN